MKGNQLIHLLLGLLPLFGSVNANADDPQHGFFLIINGPVLGRSEDNLYIYAIHTTRLQSDDQVEFEKKGGLVSQTVKTGTIPPTGSDHFGCFLSVGLSNRYKGSRYGTYDGKYTSSDGATTMMISGYVKRLSDILDTRGVYTYTAWPETSGEIQLAPDNNIGVRWSPGCRSIQWSKGKKRNVNTGPRLELKTTDDAGVYTIWRAGRRRRGWFAQIEVIVASCQMDEYLVGGALGCQSRSVTCLNGGVIKDKENGCTCPPFFLGSDCSSEVDVPTISRDFVLANGGGTTVRCGDLPGGDSKCRRYLFCFGDLYGCKCASGWWGSNCDRPCQKGMWGVNCSENCPNNEDCDRIFGP